MLNSNFVYLAAFINFIGTLVYIIDTLKGDTKPNRVTWFIWALAPLIIFSAQLSKGVGLQSLITLMVSLGPLLIFLASFVNKKAVWKIGKLDILCGLLSVTGLTIWLILKEGNFAIFFAILADFLAAIPTLIKSYRFPDTESFFGYFAAAISYGITLLTITTWNFASSAFLLYALVICLVFSIFIKFEVGKNQ